MHGYLKQKNDGAEHHDQIDEFILNNELEIQGLDLCN